LQVPFACLRRFAKPFAWDESGSVTVETVIWIPFFFFILMLITDASLAFFSRAEAFRLVERGNRAFVTGRLDTADATTLWIENAFRSKSTHADARMAIATGVVSTSLEFPAKDVVLFNTLGVLGGWSIRVQAQQYLERAL